MVNEFNGIPCIPCNRLIYTLKNKMPLASMISASDLVSSGYWPHPVPGQELICPLCHKSLIPDTEVFYLSETDSNFFASLNSKEEN